MNLLVCDVAPVATNGGVLPFIPLNAQEWIVLDGGTVSPLDFVAFQEHSIASMCMLVLWQASPATVDHFSLRSLLFRRLQTTSESHISGTTLRCWPSTEPNRTTSRHHEEERDRFGTRALLTPVAQAAGGEMVVGFSRAGVHAGEKSSRLGVDFRLGKSEAGSITALSTCTELEAIAAAPPGYFSEARDPPTVTVHPASL